MLSRKIIGMARLFRPELALAAGVCVTIGQVLAAGKLPPWRVGVLGFICAFALSSAALILNDFFDFEVDLVNHPDRPLPSGAVSHADVIWLTAVVSLIGLAAAYALGAGVLLISLLFWVVGILYNWRFKQSGLPGNLMVSASVAVTFVLGAVTMNDPWNKIVWVFSGIVFFFDLGEEIAGDTMDMEGDKKRGTRSIALIKGKRFALNVVFISWGLVILISLIPVVLGWMGVSYIIPILGTDVLIVYFSTRLYRAETPQAGRKAMRGAYLGGTIGLIAFLVGQVIR